MADEPRHPIRRALLSVSDKEGLVALAQGLANAGVTIVSTGSTAATIEQAGIPVTPVAQVTGFPECLDGRVKTLHPGIHAGLLADVRRTDHQDQLRELDIEAFDLLVVNLYPFRATVKAGGNFEDCTEQIDIGGPAMLRAAAKNHANVAVVTEPARYGWLLDQVAAGGLTQVQRRELAAAAFAHTASYDTAIANWLAQQTKTASLGATWQRRAELRYGENPHQQASWYVQVDGIDEDPGIGAAIQLQGKALSYNNLVDADAARAAAFDHPNPAVAIIKHANPCGIAIGADIETAYVRAFATDPVSAFGGVVAANRAVSAAMARRIVEVFTEVVIAPAYDDDALPVLSAKEGLRVLRVPPPPLGQRQVWRTISGGVLVQDVDGLQAAGDDPARWTLVSGSAANDAMLQDLHFAWRAVRCVKSNAILLASDGAAVGVGMGQVNRVDAAGLAVQRAGERALGSVAASDAFFPFPDGLEILMAAGVRAVVQPGGSIRDAEVIAAAQAGGITMYLTGARHFLH